MSVRCFRYPLHVLLCCMTLFSLVGCSIYPDIRSINNTTKKRLKQVKKHLKENQQQTAPKTLAGLLLMSFSRSPQVFQALSRLKEDQWTEANLALQWFPSLNLNTQSIQRTDHAGRIDSTTTPDEKVSHTITLSADFSFTNLILNQGRFQRLNADKRIHKEQLRQVYNALAINLLSHYLFIVDASQTRKQIADQLKLLESGQKSAKKLEQDELQDPLTALHYQKILLHQEETLHRLDLAIEHARAEIYANLSMMDRGLPLTVEPISSEIFIQQVTTLAKKRNRAITFALQHRSELLQGDYEHYKTELDLIEAAWAFFPEISFGPALNYSSLKKLQYPSYGSGSISFALPILRLFQTPYLQKVAKERQQQTALDNINKSLAIVAQLDLLRMDLKEANREAHYRARLKTIHTQIVQVKRGRFLHSEEEKLERLHDHSQAVSAHIDHLHAQASLFRTALTYLYHTGYDFFPPEMLQQLPPSLAKKQQKWLPEIHKHLQTLLNGDFFLIPDIIN
ncbi:TolC family protein [Magnetococcales bacterium HHB-1]